MSTVVTSPTPTGSERLGLYGKAFSGAVVAGLGAYSTALGDGPAGLQHVTPAEWIAIVLSFLASFGVVWAIPQTPAVFAKYGKLIFAGIAAAGSSLITGLLDGSLSQTEIITAIIAFSLASGLTGAVSNAASSDPVRDGKLVPVSTGAKEDLVAAPVHQEDPFVTDVRMDVNRPTSTDDGPGV